MATYAKARRRFRALERAADFPSTCCKCSTAIFETDRVTVAENAIGLPLVMHEGCYKRGPNRWSREDDGRPFSERS